MRSLWLSISGIALPLALAGCPTEPAEMVGATTTVTQPQNRGSDDPGYGFPIECFNPETSELEPNCPLSALEEVFATLRLQEEQARANDIDEDGIPNEEDPDVDGDGQPNGDDFDIDDDGEPNGQDKDADADGKSGKDDPDEDGDGLSDRFDLNDDGDGLFDDEDEDDDGDGDDEDEDEEEDDDDDEEPNPLEDLVERLRNGQLTDEDRAKIAKEITDRLNSPRVQDIVLKTLQDLGTRAVEPLRDPGPGNVPPDIAAVDAVYDQLSKALTLARREANIEAGDPLTEKDTLKALGEFIPRAQAMDELSKSFQLSSIRELGLTVSDLRAGLGSADRTREFTQALTRSAATNPIPVTEKEELDKLTTGAALLGPTFADTPGGDLLDAIRLVDGLVDSPEELADALRDLRDLGKSGEDFDDALNEVIDNLIGTIP